MTENAHRTHPPRRSILVRWDEAGNLGQLSTLDEHSGEVRSRFHLWTEDSRLHTVVDDRHHSYYAYDHAGGSCGSRAQSQACLCYAEMQQRRQSQRTLKITGQCEQLDVSAWVMHTVTSLRQFTVYPSPYVVLSNHGYTKHYYAGTERLAARQGGGFGRTILGESTEFEAATRLFDQALHQAPQLATPPEPHLLQEEHPDDVYKFMMKDIEIPENLDVHADIEMDEFLQAMQNLAAADPEPDVYFYHSDHLGSASWITDKDGNPVQHLQYLPYGEPFVNQRAAGYSERFTFTGKDSRKGWRIPLNKIKYNEQRDEETGYGYFGTRYMDHELMTMWLSVDPMADKYPSLSPYNYCMWNPIKLVDPDGREVSTHTDEWGKVIAVFEDGDNGVYMHKGDAHARVNKHYSPENTSAGGRYMGESLHSLSFADQGKYNKDGIVEPMKDMVVDYGSLELTMMANMIMDQEPSLLQYGRNAGTGGDWDIKAHVSHGSKLYGKYASPRDAGNFVAGMVAVSNGRAMENVAQFGYGAYNLSGNDKVKTFGIVAATLLLRATNPIIGIPLVDCVMNGEDKLSQRCIDLGKVYQKEKMNKR